MPRWLQFLIHFSLVGVGAWAAVATGSPIPLVVTSASQAALGGLAQIYNTDGSHQSIPYTQAAAEPMAMSPAGAWPPVAEVAPLTDQERAALAKLAQTGPPR